MSSLGKGFAEFREYVGLCLLPTLGRFPPLTLEIFTFSLLDMKLRSLGTIQYVPKPSLLTDFSLTLRSDNSTEIFLGLVILPRTCPTESCISLIACSHPSLSSLSARSGGGQAAGARYFSRCPCSNLTCPRFHVVLSPGLGKEVANSAGGTLNSGFCSQFIYHCSFSPALYPKQLL